MLCESVNPWVLSCESDSFLACESKLENFYWFHQFSSSVSPSPDSETPSESMIPPQKGCESWAPWGAITTAFLFKFHLIRHLYISPHFLHVSSSSSMSFDNLFIGFTTYARHYPPMIHTYNYAYYSPQHNQFLSHQPPIYTLIRLYTPLFA